MSESSEQQWYIVQAEVDGYCEIVTQAPSNAQKMWGPFGSQGEAIARRVGLIRAGKCQPR
ncbi:MAG: hypothetical protein F6J87_06465 [Spirulina sp. SIO3F2]|nr:hypothetical protein [Spirulina sp. SIO3F2]